MANILNSKLGRRGRKVISYPIHLKDITFTDEFSEMYDQFSQNWQTRARALRERRLAALKYQ